MPVHVNVSTSLALKADISFMSIQQIVLLIVSFHKLGFAHELMTVQTFLSYLSDKLSSMTQILSKLLQQFENLYSCVFSPNSSG